MSLFRIASVVALAVSLTSSTMAWAGDIVVATDASNVPFEYKQGNEYVGFDIDLWSAIAKEAGITYELRPMDFSGIIPALQTGQVDVALASITIKAEREKVIDFSDPYYDSGFSLLVLSNSTIKGTDDLKGKLLALKTGTAAVDYAKEHFAGTELRLFPNSDNAYLEVATGRADGAIHDTPSVLYYIKTAGNGNVKTVGEQMMAQKYGIAFPKGSALRSKVNLALAKLKSDGTYSKIYEKWFGAQAAK